MDKTNNCPHILSFIDSDSDIQAQYFVAIEQQTLIECRSIHSAIFTLLAVHFVFNLEYNPRVKDVLHFLHQDVMGFSNSTYRKSAIFSSFCAAVQCYLPES